MKKPTLHWDDSAEKVIKLYSDMVYRLAFARTGTKYDAEEIFQEVFLRYFRKIPLFHNEEHRKAWLIRVTLNCSKKLFISSRKQNEELLEEEITFEQKENKDLYCELQKLPPKYREVIHLFYYEDLSLEEISRILHRKNATVRTQLTRARALLRNFMKEEDYV